jgi:hypothetical protein
MFEPMNPPTSPFNIFVLFLALLQTGLKGEDWRSFEDLNGRKLEAKVISVLGERAKVLRKSDRRIVPLPFNILIEADREYLRNWKAEPLSGSNAEEEDDGDNVSSRLYPRTKVEIKAKTREIENRRPPKGVSKEYQDSINQLNIYRYLSGVPADVVTTPELIANCEAAAQACLKNGGLSHDIGNFTNKCNLHQGRGLESSLSGFIGDPGANNRERRGHRRWCLDYPMGKSAFGQEKGFVAMWAMDQSGKKPTESWSYPGRGFYPQERVHGNAWSLYLTQNAPPKDQLTVELFKLPNRPERAYGRSSKIPGKQLPTEYVSVYDNAINFEPDSSTLGNGVYWVRIHGGGISEGYVVELY